VAVWGKVGKAVTITDNSENYQPQPFMQGWDNGDGWVQRLKHWLGEITITQIKCEFPNRIKL
jgi:hypothetical protein